MVQDNGGSSRILGGTPAIYNPSTTLACEFNMFGATLLWGHRRMSSFAHIAEVINSAKPDVLVNSTECERKSNRLVGELEAVMDRSSKGDTVEFRAKDRRRIKLELKTRAGNMSCSCRSDVRINESEAVDKVYASIHVESVRKNTSAFVPPDKRNDAAGPNTWYTGFKTFGVDRFGLPSDSQQNRAAGQPTKVIFKWLPLKPESVKLKQKDAHFVLKDDAKRCTCWDKQEIADEIIEQAEPAVAKNKHNEVLKNFVCGGFAGVVSRTAVAPLDLIKTHLITAHGLHGYHKTATEIFLEIWKADGWRGLFRGNGVNCIRVAPSKAIELCVFEAVKNFIGKDGHILQGIAAPVAGGAAGMAGTLATYPLELIRTRISLQPHKYTGAVEAILKVFREEGFGALYAGLTPSVLGVFPYAATNYFVYDGLRSAYQRASGNRHVPTGLTLLFGAVAAAASSTVTYPLEVARRQMQLGSAALVPKNSTLDLVREIYAEEGFLALYRGLGTTWLKLVPAAAISFVCYEAARKAWELEQRKKSG